MWLKVNIDDMQSGIQVVGPLKVLYTPRILFTQLSGLGQCTVVITKLAKVRNGLKSMWSTLSSADLPLVITIKQNE